MLRRLLFILVLATPAAMSLSSSSAYAQSLMDHYRAYNEAIENNDPIAADEHGEAAWRAAEDELGAAQETAVLAYNLARLRIDSTDPASALEPARRVLELAEDGFMDGVAAAEEIELLAAMAEVAQGRTRQAERDRLQAAIRARENIGQPDDMLARARLLLAQKLPRNTARSDVAAIAHQAFENFSALGPAYADLAIQSATIEGGAHLEAENNAQAEDAFAAALDAFPQGTRPANSPSYAQLYAWRAFAADLARHEERLDEARAGDASACQAFPGGYRRAASISLHNDLPEDLNCGAWLEQAPAPFPTWAAERSKQGAVVIVYSLDRTGKVVDPRVAAEVPEDDRWEESALVAMTSWRRDLPADADPQCRAPQATAFVFTLTC